MIIQTIYYSSHFTKAFQKLPRVIQQKAIKRERVFRNNPFDEGLKTHKLKGELEHYWSFSISYSYRILFQFSGKNEVVFIDIGGHSIYK